MGIENITIQHSMPPFLPENFHLSINKSKASTAVPPLGNPRGTKI